MISQQAVQLETAVNTLIKTVSVTKSVMTSTSALKELTIVTLTFSASMKGHTLDAVIRIKVLVCVPSTESSSMEATNVFTSYVMKDMSIRLLLMFEATNLTSVLILMSVHGEHTTVLKVNPVLTMRAALNVLHVILALNFTRTM